MASGKKGKKPKGKTLNLTEFLQETPGSIPIQPIRKSTSNWADEVEDYDGYDSRKPLNVVLPTAPKASRDYDDITNKVPMEPPFCAYLSNLPYDVDEDEIAAFFKNMKIANMRIPKDDRGSDGTRSKGYGYIEFEDRDSLLDALVLRETTLKNRRMRIEVASNMENDRRRTGRMDIGRDRGDRSESSGDWRSGPRAEPLPDNDRRGGFNRDRDSGFGREREGGFTRDGMRNPDRDDRSFNRDNRDGGGFNRDRDSSFRRDRDNQEDRLTNWRDGDRPNRDMDRDKERDRGFNRDRGNFRDSERGREERRGFGPRRFENDRDGPSRDDRDSERTSTEPRERPKLILAPRTKPIEQVPVSESVPSAAIFGNAKPVDTTQREKEIEEKLAKEQSETSDSRDRQKHHSTERKRSIDRNRPTRRAEDSPERDRKDGISPRRQSPKRSPRRSSPRRSSPRRSSPRRSSPRRSSPRRSSPRRSSPRRSSPRRSSPRRSSPRRSSPRRSSPRRSSPRRASPRRSSPRRASPRRSSPRRASPRRSSPRRTPARRTSPRRQSPKRNYDEKKGPPKNDHKSPEKVRSEKPKREEKRDRHEKEMPKMTEPEPPNFAANNKFAFLDTEDNSD